MAGLKLEKSEKCFEGWQLIYSHDRSDSLAIQFCSIFSYIFSVENRSRMRFAIYLPPQAKCDRAISAEDNPQSYERRPVLYWLSGLTCTEENFIIKSGFQR